MYLVVVKYDAKANFVQVLKFDDSFNTVIESIEINLNNLGSYTIETNARPLNYSVDRNNKVLQNVGSFTRLLNSDKNNKNHIVNIILNEIQNEKGKTLGYKVLNCGSFTISNITTENLLAAASQYNSPIIQNAIIRNNTINCYPNKPFLVTVIKSSKSLHKKKDSCKNWIRMAKKTKCDSDLIEFIEQNQYLYVEEIYDKNGSHKPRKKGITTGYNLNTFSNNLTTRKKMMQYNNKEFSVSDLEKLGKSIIGAKTTKLFITFLKNKYKSKAIIVKEHNEEFNKAQNHELELCKQNGVDPSLIDNPDLTNAQMRVIWKSKQNGALSEAFNKPYYSVDSMKFYADRVFTEEDKAKYQKLLDHPELSKDELDELYTCICDDIEYEDLIGDTAVDICIEREHRKNRYLEAETDFYVFDKALKAAMLLQGYY